MVDDDSDDAASRALGARDLIGLGGALVAAVVGGLVVGLVLDNALGTSPAFVLVGIAVGIVAGGVAFWIRVRSALGG